MRNASGHQCGSEKSELEHVTFITIYIYNSQNTGHTAELTVE